MMVGGEIQRAIGIISERRRGIGKRGSRIHQNQLEDNRNRQRALEGLCGQCKNLALKFGKDKGGPIAKVECQVRKSPLLLYQFTPPGERAQCDKFEQK